MAVDRLLEALAVLDQEADESMRDVMTRCLIEAQVCEHGQRMAAAAAWRAFLGVVMSVSEDHMATEGFGG